MQSDFYKIIYAAIKGKYKNISRDYVEALIAASLANYSSVADANLLLSAPRTPTSTLETDVANQCLCLYLIETHWRYLQPSREFLEVLHAVCYGQDIDCSEPRTEDYIADYGGVVPYRVTDIEEGIASISNLILQVSSQKDSSIIEKSQFISSVFVKIIKVHPFADGNGRAARMIVQCFLRSWGDDYIVIPKVRSCSIWRVCLQDAIHGEYSKIINYFSNRIRSKD